MAKLKPNEKRVQLSFFRLEDLALYDWLERKAYHSRLLLDDFILLALQEAFPVSDRDEVEPIPEQFQRSSKQAATDRHRVQAHHTNSAALDTPEKPAESVQPEPACPPSPEPSVHRRRGRPPAVKQ